MIGTNSMEDIIMKMKKITYALLAIAFIASLEACSGEEEIQIEDEDTWEYFIKQYDETTPHTPGTFVMFGANTFYKNGEAETRTQYSGEEIEIGSNKYERIDWIDGDKLQIYCNQSSSSVNNAVYAINESTIAVNQDDKRQSVATVTLDSEQGLKWSETDSHVFIGLYPAEETFGENAGEHSYPKVTANADDFRFITCVPKQQPYLVDDTHVDTHVDMRLAGMVAKTTATLEQRGNVSMVYYPIVTTLQFDLQNVSKSDITINEIFIDGPEVAGTYDVTVPGTLQNITSPASEISFDCDPKGQISVVGINKTLVKDSEEKVRVVMFALPIEFTHAKLGIKMTINGQDVTRKIALNEKKSVTVTNEDGTTSTTTVKEDIVFQPTHKYNFTIKIPESTVFEVTPESHEYDIPGGAAPFNVTSYTYNAIGEKVPVAWTATQYSLDGGESWIDFGESVLTPDEYGLLPTMLEGWDLFNTVDVAEADRQFVTPVNGTVSYNKPPYRKLKEATLNNPAVNVDLSMRDVNGNPTSLRNTANCYMVHAGGTYRFPIVYGNAIKNDVPNPIAYKPTMDRSTEEIADSIAYNPDASVINRGWGGVNRVESHFLSPFINHNGDAITSPYISGVNGAKLIWQDAEGLITSVGIDNGYVTFTVTNNMANLVEGNALIAVTDGANGTGNILWSWHIWITEMTDETNVNAPADAIGGVYSGQTQASTIMSKNLVDNAIQGVTGAKIAGVIGLCDISVGPKDILIKFVQEGTNDTEIVTLTQKGRFNVNAPMYQYGRKDPLQFQKGLYEAGAYDDITVNERRTNKTFYDIEGNVVSNYPNGAAYMKRETFPSGTGVLSSSIKYPDTFCMNAAMDGKYYNLWAARLTRPGRYDALRADKTKTIYDPSPVGYRVPSLADVAGWAGNNGYKDPYVAGRVSYNRTGHYVIVTLYENVLYPILAGRGYSQGYYGSADWAQTEAASWVSTPNFFSIVNNDFSDENTPFPNEQRGGIFPKYNPGQYKIDRHTEDFDWYYYSYNDGQYRAKLNSRWSEAAGASYQIRFNVAQSWMNESGGSRGNAVNLLMVKERDNDTVTDPPYVEPADPTPSTE